MKCNISAWCRQTLTDHAKKRIAGFGLLCTLLLAGILSSCTDDEFPGAGMNAMQTRSVLRATNPGGLVQKSNGTWMSQGCRVPIVGPGRIVTYIGNDGLVEVGVAGNNKIENAVDTDLSNYTTTSTKIVSADAYTPIISIRDIHHTYSAGQKVGFIFKETGGSLLSAKVLDGITIQTFLHGSDDPQETIVAKGDENSLLNLNLLSITSNGGGISDREISFEATKDFDEVRLCLYGIGANVISSMDISVKYAFVGENREIRATSETEFSDYWSTVPTIGLNNIENEGNIVDSNIGNSAPFTSEGWVASYATVNFQKTIPAGTEIGFRYSSKNLASISVLGENAPTISTYNDKDEEIESSTPKGNLLGIGLIQNTQDAYISMQTTQACTQARFTHPSKLLSLGGMNVYYAYVREPVKLDPVCYFALSDDDTYSTSYQLPTPSTGKVTYVVEGVDGTQVTVSPSYLLQNMTKPGKYKVTALYTDPSGRQVLQTVTITKKNAVSTGDCNIYITDAEITNAIDGQGGISISGISGAANIINSNHDDYATYVGILDLATSKPLVALTTRNKISTDNGMRVGFEVQALTGLLDLSVLDAYEIKVYDGNNLVESSGPEGHTVNAGVLNFDNSRVRLSVNIGSGKQFDHIELWLKGVLGLANTQKIYNVFYESTDCKEEGVNEACMEVLTNTGHNLDIDYEHTQIGSIVGLLGGDLKNVEDMLDGSLDTYATCEGINLLSNIKISLKFDEQPAKQPIGIVLSDGNSILNADILGKITLKVYQDETEIASSKSDFTTVNVDLFSKNGKTYLEIPWTDIAEPYNRIELVSTSVLNLSSLNIRGIYTRVDSDGDGIPDCSDDVTSGSLTLAGGITHLCEGDPVSIPVESTTLKGGTKLSLAWENRDNGTEGTTNCTLSEDRKFLQVDGAASWEKGRYYVDILQREKLQWNHAEVYVHPKETTWKPQDNSTDWNTWDNWTNGVPWDCSNVFIPANVGQYPVLSASGTEEYWCYNIHFAPGAELIGQSHLHYTQAFVDMNLSPGAYHLISAPLQDMVTGDMFVAQNVNDWETWRAATSSDGHQPNYFKPIDGEKQGNDNNSAYIEQRINPFIYQRFWNSTVRNETLTRSYNTTDKAITEFTDWSRSFNAVETNYEVGQGFALKAGDKTNATPYHFHFPKSFSIYNYYGINGNSLKGSSIARTGQIGRLWTAEQINGLTLKRETSGTLYIFGNPFMAHINIKKFLAKNTGVTCVKIYQNGEYVDIINNNVADAAQIAPMQAVFLTATAGTRLRITLSEDMLEQGKSSTRLTRRMANQVRLTATSNRHSASCVVVSSSSGNDKFNSREDVTLLVGSEEGSGVAVYTIADGKALSIQRMKSATRIPVGFYLKQAGNVNLAFDASDDIWNSWRLKDQQTGRSYPLKGKITLDNVSTGSGRFFLEKVQ